LKGKFGFIFSILYWWQGRERGCDKVLEKKNKQTEKRTDKGKQQSKEERK
jgi:hypothetical protein